MQRTRINLLFNLAISKITVFLANPWRNLSLLFIALLFGFFIASAVASIVGQRADWDITVAFFCVIFVEIASIIIYRRRQKDEKIIGLDILNSFKMGFTYGLFLEAMKLNS